MSQPGVHKLPLFWWLNFLGWFSYGAAAFLLYYTGGWGEVDKVFWFFYPYLIGSLVCIVLHLGIKKYISFFRSVPKLALIVVVIAILGANLWFLVDLLTTLIMSLPGFSWNQFLRQYLSGVFSRAMPLMGWTVLYFSLLVWNEWKQQEKRTLAANDLAQTAQLQMLRYQLDPHFLFNSLNSIRALIDENERTAQDMITELSEFLRYSLESKQFSNVPLKDEIDAIRYYFAIQKKRYEEKLQVDFAIENRAGEFPVLSFLIHPLIENAVKYGMQTSAMPLRIQIRARISAGSLKLEVFNTGEWLPPTLEEESSTHGTGTGLENVRQRLENAFPDSFSLKIGPYEDGVRVVLEIFIPDPELHPFPDIPV